MRRLLVLPTPTSPPPGPVDIALSLLLHRALPFEPERLLAVRERLGHSGSVPRTRTSVVAGSGLSRDVVERAEGRVATLAQAVGPPVTLSEALRLLGAGPVRTALAATLELHAAGLLENAVHPASVQAVADVFGRDSHFRVERLRDGSHLLVPRPRQSDVRRFRAAVVKAMRYGPARVPELPIGGMAADVPALLLADRPDVTVFGDWHWRVPDRSPVGVAHTVRRMLTVGPQRLTDVQKGVLRTARYEPRVPQAPLPVLRAYIASQPDYPIDRAVTTLAADAKRAELSRTDRAIVAAFDGVEERSMAELRAALVTTGIRAPGAGVLVLRSPIVGNTSYGRYVLRTHHAAGDWKSHSTS